MEFKCSICSHSQHKKNSFESRTGKQITIIFCKNCGHGLQAINKDYDIYSSGEFSKIARNQSNTPSAGKIKELDKKAFKRFKFYKKYFSDVNSALEVGSSIGSFIHLMKLAGIEAEGIEPDPFYSDFSKKQYGFQQQKLLFENFNPSNKYDLVYSFHVIEHIPDVTEFIKKSYDILKPNGKLLIECPSWDLHSFGDVKFTVWEPHLQYFTLSSIYTLVAQNGFHVDEINYIGSALYLIARKKETKEYSSNKFKQYKRRSLRTFGIISRFPEIPIRIKGTNISKLILQYIFSKNNRSLKELLLLFIFSIRNMVYLIQEKGFTKKKISHVSYYSGWENAGDTVLSKCVRKFFHKKNGRGWNLIKITDPVDSKVISKINRSDYLIIGGGGVLLPDSNLNSISGWQWAIDAKYLREIKVPIIVFAIGYNFFKGQKNTELFVKSLETLVRKADFFSLRNHGSIQKVRALLPEDLHHKIGFQPCPTTIIRNLYPKFPSKKQSKFVGINIAYDRYERRYGKDMYLILDQIAIALKKIEDKGHHIINVCHLENDSKFEISLERRNVHFSTVNLQYKLPKEVYKFYNGIELMIGTRGHAQMIPFGLNTKIISLGAHDKLRFFLEDINAIDWYIDLHSNQHDLSNLLLKKFNEIMNEKKTEVENRLINEQEKLFNQSLENLHEIEKILATST